MDVNKLSTGERVAGGAGIALFIIMFIGWWGAPDVNVDLGGIGGDVNVSGGIGSANAWQAASFLDLIWALAALSGVALALVAGSQSKPNLPVALSAIVAGLGGLATLTILYRILDTPFDLTRKVGVFLGLIAAAGITYGGWVAMQEEGTTFSDQADRLQGDGPNDPPSAA